MKVNQLRLCKGLYQKVLLADEFKGINIDLLFKDYEKKIEIAKNVLNL